MREAFLCLGSNIEPQKNIQFAINALRQKFDVVKLSNAYESVAVGFEGGNFFNVVVQVSTSFSLAELKKFTDDLEKQAGRIRVERGRYDSRTLDVDVVMHDDLLGEACDKVFACDDIVKHAHVLLPLVDLVGDRQHPTLGIGFSELWEQFDDSEQRVWKVELV